MVASSKRHRNRRVYSKPAVGFLEMDRFESLRGTIEDWIEEAAEETWARDCGASALAEDCVPWAQVKATLGL